MATQRMILCIAMLFLFPTCIPSPSLTGPSPKSRKKTGVLLGVPRRVPVRPDAGVAPRGGRARVDKDNAFPRGAAGGPDRSHVTPTPPRSVRARRRVVNPPRPHSAP